MCKVLWVPQIQDIEWTNPAMFQKNLKIRNNNLSMTNKKVKSDLKPLPWPDNLSKLLIFTFDFVI